MGGRRATEMGNFLGWATGVLLPPRPQDFPLSRLLYRQGRPCRKQHQGQGRSCAVGHCSGKLGWIVPSPEKFSFISVFPSRRQDLLITGLTSGVPLAITHGIIPLFVNGASRIHLIFDFSYQVANSGIG